MTPRQWTQVVLLIAFISLGAYDLWAFYRWGKAFTLSVVVHQAARDHPIVAFALGVLSGHLFWPISE